MPLYAYAILIAGTAIWFAPFPLARSRHKGSAVTDTRARWGMVLEVLGYSLLWQGRFWETLPGEWQFAFSIGMFGLASLLSWTSSRALGRQFRLDAALGAEHQLIRSGPYRVVRHPVYTSMLCVLIATGLLLSSPFLFLISFFVFLTGTEIRMRVEERLLASRFGVQFDQYKNRVSRLVPYLF